MHYYEWSFWGMHIFWWLFWIAVIALMFTPMAPVGTGRRRQSPLEVLQRRYAAGEISTAEYEERKAALSRDIQAAK